MRPSPRKDEPGPAGPRTPVPFLSPKQHYRLSAGLWLWLGLKVVAAALFATRHTTAGLVAYFVWDPWLVWNILRPASRGFGPVVSSFLTAEREVWLTIDDGPDPLTTPRVLDLLDEYEARATFFVVGEQVYRHPELAREIARRGHELANHTASHPCGTFWSAGPRRVLAEIDGCNDAVSAAGLPRPRYFRPPVGIKTPFLHAQLHRRGMGLVAWSARGYDSLLSTDLAVRRIVAGIRPGAVVLLHDGHRDVGRVAVIERVLEHLKRTGYRAILPSRESLVG